MLKVFKVEVKWRKDKVRGKHREFWEFWSCGNYFSCICLSIHKKRSPRRIFLGFAKYRSLLENSKFIDNGSSFWVKEEFIYKKSIE